MSAFYPLLEVNSYARWWVICGFSSAFGSALYPLFNPQIRMSADPHFTRSRRRSVHNSTRHNVHYAQNIVIKIKESQKPSIRHTRYFHSFLHNSHYDYLRYGYNYLQARTFENQLHAITLASHLA